MTNLVIIDADVTFAPLYDALPYEWRGWSEDCGRLSFEYFYDVDDALLDRLLALNMMYSTGTEDTIVKALEEAGKKPFAAASSGMRRYAGPQMNVIGARDNQRQRIRDVAAMVDREKGLSRICRFSHWESQWKHAMYYVAKETGVAYRPAEVVANSSHGRLVSLTGKDGTVLSRKPAGAQLVRLYGAWQDVDKDTGEPSEYVAPPVPAVDFEDQDEITAAIDGASLGMLLKFYAYRKDKKIKDALKNAERVETVYIPQDLLGVAGETPEFASFEDAKNWCADTYRKAVRPVLVAQNLPLLAYARTEKNGKFHVFLKVPPPPLSVPYTIVLGNAKYRVAPGEELDVFRVAEIKRRTVQESTGVTGRVLAMLAD